MVSYSQRRKDGSENLHRYWWEYEMGFGSLTGEFWFGLNALHCLTSQGEWELHIDLKLTNGTIIYLPYKQFAVGPASEQYPLTISGFTGYTNDPFFSHLTPDAFADALNTLKFTTRDQDNDRHPNNCVNIGRGGGWWYSHCAYINPTSYYNFKQGILLNGKFYSPKFLEIKIRYNNCT